MFSRLCAGALLVATPVAPAMADIDHAFDRDCWDQRELAAARVQQFKTMLLVGALHCRDVEPYVMTDYNHFVDAKRGFINTNAQIVRDRFIRKFGLSYGSNAFSDYETSIGNRLARAGFDRYRCEMIGNYARLAADVSEAGLIDLAYSADDQPEPAVCTPAMRYADGRWTNRDAVEPSLPPSPPPPAPLPSDAVAEAATVPVAEPKPAPAVAQSEWPDLAPVEPESQPVAVDPNQAVEVARADTAPPAPVVQSAVVEAPAAPNPTAALRAAIKSLTAAVEALEASQAVPPTQP